MTHNLNVKNRIWNSSNIDVKEMFALVFSLTYVLNAWILTLKMLVGQKYDE